MRTLAQLLENRIGLDCGSLGPSALSAALSARMRATGCESEDRYVALASVDSGEMQKLVDEVVVSETWFMRDGQPFAELARVARAHAGPGPFRVLTLPCASGEEPFSVAITLLESAGAARFAVEAVDISARALLQAERGLFGERSFRADDGSLRRRWFSRTEGGWQIDPTLKQYVSFRQGNVLDQQLGHKARYEAIFCRNLLIYLGPEARTKALGNLRRLLLPGGTLFVGHAEALERMDESFTRVGPTAAFAYRARANAPATGRHPLLEPVSKAGRPARETGSKPAQDAPRAAPRVEFDAAAQARLGAAPAPELLSEARALADRGRLQEAQALCERHIAREPADPRAHALLGVVHQARGDLLGARSSLERALYLDPEREETIAHLMLVHERLGDKERAEALHRRAERVKNRKGSRA